MNENLKEIRKMLLEILEISENQLNEFECKSIGVDIVPEVEDKIHSIIIYITSKIGN